MSEREPLIDPRRHYSWPQAENDVGTRPILEYDRYGNHWPLASDPVTREPLNRLSFNLTDPKLRRRLDGILVTVRYLGLVLLVTLAVALTALEIALRRNVVEMPKPVQTAPPPASTEPTGGMEIIDQGGKTLGQVGR